MFQAAQCQLQPQPIGPDASASLRHRLSGETSRRFIAEAHLSSLKEELLAQSERRHWAELQLRASEAEALERSGEIDLLRLELANWVGRHRHMRENFRMWLGEVHKLEKEASIHRKQIELHLAGQEAKTKTEGASQKNIQPSKHKAVRFSLPGGDRCSPASRRGAQPEPLSPRPKEEAPTKEGKVLSPAGKPQANGSVGGWEVGERNQPERGAKRSASRAPAAGKAKRFRVQPQRPCKRCLSE
jgi:hypothetical protein